MIICPDTPYLTGIDMEHTFFAMHLILKHSLFLFFDIVVLTKAMSVHWQ